MPTQSSFSVRVYYEDTDHSGVVYHANYLKYFERAREHLLGVDELVALWNEHGVGFVVYRADITYKKGAEFGDDLTIKTHVEKESDFRLIFTQVAHLTADQTTLVTGRIELVCVDQNRKLVRLPNIVLEGLSL